MHTSVHTRGSAATSDASVCPVSIHNELPRPRALLEDLTDEVAAAVSPFFPVTKRIAAADEVYEGDWDVLITAAHAITRSPHLHVIAFGSSLSDMPYGVSGLNVTSRPPAGTQLAFGVRSLAAELRIPSEVTGSLRSLVERDIAARFSELTEKRALGILPVTPLAAAVYTALQSAQPPPAKTTVNALRLPRALGTLLHPLLTLSDQGIVAVAYVRSAGWSATAVKELVGGDCWLLPGFVNRHSAWVAEALSSWHVRYPDQFPGQPEWWRRSRWATPEQDAVVVELAAAEQLRVEELARLDRHVMDLRDQLVTADLKAASGMQRLLTADGPELESAVADAFRLLGFVVREMDTVHRPGDRREDLRLTDSDSPRWECLVEVKGYTRGAAVTDLARLHRWSARYAVDEHRPPDALWHVVNHFRKTDPETRTTALPNDDELVEFGSDGGLLVDTRQLFAVLKQVAAGALTSQEVRRRMRTQRGRWDESTAC